MSIFVWLVYMALEPFARRHWPHMLISWTRFLGGAFRDPLVGRDLLIGSAAAVLMALISGPLLRIVPAWLGSPPAPPRRPFFVASPLDALAWTASVPLERLVWTLGIVFFLVFVRRLVKVEWLAAAIVTLLFSANFLGNGLPILIVGIFSTAVLVFVSIRYGLLSALTTAILAQALLGFLRTSDPSAWYFYTGPFVIAVVLGIAIWGFRTAAGRRLAPGT